MRVVEPKRSSGFRKKRSNTKLRLLGILLFIFSVAIGFWFVRTQRQANEVRNDVAIVVGSTEENNSTEDVLALDTGGLRMFTQEEFRTFYDNLVQPNLDAIDTAPIITGNDIADTRIRQIAMSRGYKLRDSPYGALTTIAGGQVQPEVVEPWYALQAAANKAGHSIIITSAYRSVEDQRALFLERLSIKGVAVDDIAAGIADDKVTEVLIAAAIPGFSKHHTGYTIDILCEGYVFEKFNTSPCFDWISADNYKIAKTYGFIPSYPEESDLQGPDPEAWEYVYVGTKLLSR